MLSERVSLSVYQHQPVTKLKLYLETHTELYSSTDCFGLPSGLSKLSYTGKDTLGRRAFACKGALSESDLTPKYPSLTLVMK